MMARKFVFTGAAKCNGEHFVRELLVEAAEAKGLRVGTSICSPTDILVTNNPDSGSQKAKKAKSLGCEVWGPTRFLQFLEEM